MDIASTESVAIYRTLVLVGGQQQRKFDFLRMSHASTECLKNKNTNPLGDVVAVTRFMRRHGLGRSSY